MDGNVPQVDGVVLDPFRIGEAAVADAAEPLHLSPNEEEGRPEQHVRRKGGGDRGREVAGGDGSQAQGRQRIG